MIQTPWLPAFADPVHDAQACFRGLLSALAHPGRSYRLPGVPSVPVGVMPSWGAAALTLLDDRTGAWISAAATDAIRGWLSFHTGCRWVTDPQQADFALVLDPRSMPPVTAFAPGTPELPERSTTLLIQIPALEGERWIWSGPGIETQQAVMLQLDSEALVAALELSGSRYPLGVDLLLCCGYQVIGLPRSVICQRG